jgi:hypothetical protein
MEDDPENSRPIEGSDEANERELLRPIPKRAGKHLKDAPPQAVDTLTNEKLQN